MRFWSRFTRRWFHRPRARRVLLLVGFGELKMSNFTINPGQTKTLTAVFTDALGNVDPLGALPTATDPNGLLTLTAMNTTGSAPAVTDKEFQWSVSCPASATVGTALEIDVQAEGDPTPGVDTIKGKILGSVIAPEDTQVSLSVV